MNSINFTYLMCDQAVQRLMNDFSDQIWNYVSAEIEDKVWDQVIEQIQTQIQIKVDEVG